MRVRQVKGVRTLRYGRLDHPVILALHLVNESRQPR